MTIHQSSLTTLTTGGVGKGRGKDKTPTYYSFHIRHPHSAPPYVLPYRNCYYFTKEFFCDEDEIQNLQGFIDTPVLVIP